MRRCEDDNGACQVKYNRMISMDLPVSTVLPSPRRDWKKIAGNVRTARKIDVDWDNFTSNKYLFSHVSIVSSVETEENGYYIKPACSELVNNNGNAWTNPILASTFKTFVGGHNFCEHVQIESESKGRILDAVLRPIKHIATEGPAAGKSSDVHYCDILVATDRCHDDLCRSIVSGEMNSVSMGAYCKYVTCSKCGSVFDDNDPSCEHLDKEILSYFKDENGVERRVAELCGRLIKDKQGNLVADPESNKFFEASWVANPAFTGAVHNYFIGDAEIDLQKVVGSLSDDDLYDNIDNIFGLRVADARGMAVLRVARREISRRRRFEMINRIAKGL